MAARGKVLGVGRDVWLLGVLGAVALLLVGYLVMDRVRSEDRPPEAAAAAEGSAPGFGPVGDLSRRIDGDPLARGAVDAPVTMVVFSDYRCPFCAKFSRDTEPQLVERYVDSGQLRIEWRDLPLFGDQSRAAAVAGRAAAAQGKFWEFNSALYAAAPDRGHPEFDAAALRGFAEQAGVPDLERFDRDAAGADFDRAVGSDLLEAKMLGVSSTPAFVINGYPVLGAQPLDVFVDTIETAAGR
ncbi:thioredoxin domain-containing protein [Prescottella sp. R16]|uniref:DsbA family protein n=1 Tax=Prescottella sp. R16 TaxID=3064529 RepID=UPI00272E78BB|nr:thioredoxin domain-containing protein [Prescottella sp. R16]